MKLDLNPVFAEPVRENGPMQKRRCYGVLLIFTAMTAPRSICSALQGSESVGL